MPKKQPQLPSAEDLYQQVAELTEALQRERADAVNVRRRAEEEKSHMGTFYKSLVVRELLPLIDNFERALKAVPQTSGKQPHSPAEQQLIEWVKGVEGIIRQFEAVLRKIGVERIKTVGEVFDPQVHEAISMEEGEGTTEVVTEELQAGYKLQNEILRHAVVRVSLK